GLQTRKPVATVRASSAAESSRHSSAKSPSVRIRCLTAPSRITAEDLRADDTRCRGGEQSARFEAPKVDRRKPDRDEAGADAREPEPCRYIAAMRCFAAAAASLFGCSLTSCW